MPTTKRTKVIAGAVGVATAAIAGALLLSPSPPDRNLEYNAARHARGLTVDVYFAGQSVDGVYVVPAGAMVAVTEMPADVTHNPPNGCSDPHGKLECTSDHDGLRWHLFACRDAGCTRERERYR